MRISLVMTALSGVVLVAGILPRLRRLQKRPPRDPAPDTARAAHLRLTAPNARVLDHLCRSITTVISARPGLCRVSIDLTRLRAIDASNVASLRYALRQLERAGVEASVDGPRSPRKRAAEPSRTLH